MKIAIIIPNIIEATPYVKYYTDVFDKLGLDYEYICWDRNHFYSQQYFNNKMSIYRKYSPESNNLLRKLFDFWFFSKYVKDSLRKNNYDFITVHTIVCSIFLSKILITTYRSKYIFDIRDFSPIFPFVKNMVSRLINYSAFSTISSYGYTSWLPIKFKYVIGHNVSKVNVDNSLYSKPELSDISKVNKEIVILTIGQIRDFSSNSKIIRALGNKPNIKVVFAGDGLERNNLESFSKNNYFNIYFSGWYDKQDEKKIVEKSDFINIVLPPSSNFRTQFGNRFYLSLIYRKPMIVNVESIQAKYVAKYNLGIVLTQEDDLYESILKYIETFDMNIFENGCIEMLKIVKGDIENFESKIIRLFE